MKVRFLGPGVLITRAGKLFKAVGGGAVVDLEEARAQILLDSGAASRDLRQHVDEVSVMEPDDVVVGDPEELEMVSAAFNSSHDAITDALAKRAASVAAVAAKEVAL